MRKCLLLKTTMLLAVAQFSFAQPETYKRVNSIKFEGSTIFNASNLKAQFRWVRTGALVTSDIIEADIEVNLKAFFKEHGFVQCNVTFQEVPLTAQDINIRVTVSEGRQYRLSSLDFKGSSLFTKQDIAKLFDIHPGDIVNMKKIKEGLEQVKLLHERYGFIAFSYIPVQAFDEQNKTMSLSFTFDQGKQFFISYIGIVGCRDQAEEDRIRTLMALRPNVVFCPAQLQSETIRLTKILGVDVKSYTDINEREGRVGVVFWLKPDTKD